MSDDKIVLTREGRAEIERELEELLTVKRPALTDRIREARQLGDLSENFDYQDAKRQQGMLEARINELKAILKRAVIVDCSSGNGCVGVGSKVVVKDLDEAIEEEYTIVGGFEASPADGRISCESCVGKALIGAKEGDIVEVMSPGGVFKYKVISVS